MTLASFEAKLARDPRSLSEANPVKHYIEQPDTLVQDAIDGLIQTSNGTLTRLDGYPEIKVVLRSDWSKDKVAVISGGGSGHEPAHAGFIGQGLLTAAVCGEVFASPSVEAVMAAIRTVTGEPGALLVVKNYTGDRLNFGLALEKAKEEGYKVEMVVVSDDVSIPDSSQPRGIAGTLFVHKVAGYLAERGEELSTVLEEAQRAAQAAQSLGLALTTCHPPGSSDKETIPAGKIEIGLGIHGEPGVEKAELVPARQLMERVCGDLETSLPDGELALMLNNLGSVPPLEMTILAQSLLATSLGQRAKCVLGPGRFMTSYDMNGFSVSALPLNELFLDALTAEVECPYWPSPVSPQPVSPQALPPSGHTEFQASQDQEVRSKLEALCGALKEAKKRLNGLDAKIGDGDAGDTFYTAASAVEEKLDQLPLAEPKQLLAAISQLLSRAMGGSSGALLSLLTQAASSRFEDDNWAVALLAGTDKMMEYGGAQIGDRTMLDALVPALEALRDGSSLENAAEVAEKKAKETAKLSEAGAGRSSYLSEESLKGVEDPGARAVAIAFGALVEAKNRKN